MRAGRQCGTPFCNGLQGSDSKKENEIDRVDGKGFSLGNSKKKGWSVANGTSWEIAPTFMVHEARGCLHRWHVKSMFYGWTPRSDLIAASRVYLRFLGFQDVILWPFLSNLFVRLNWIPSWICLFVYVWHFKCQTARLTEVKRNFLGKNLEIQRQLIIVFHLEQHSTKLSP